jgi:hypothetical protein
VAQVLVYHLEVKGSIPPATMFFFPAVIMILVLLSSAGAHDVLYRMLLAGIFPSKRTHKKCVIVVPGISSPIKQNHKNPIEPIKISPAGIHQFFCYFLNGDVTLVLCRDNCASIPNITRREHIYFKLM